jgi:hypothetical protein
MMFSAPDRGNDFRRIPDRLPQTLAGQITWIPARLVCPAQG